MRRAGVAASRSACVAALMFACACDGPATRTDAGEPDAGPSVGDDASVARPDAGPAPPHECVLASDCPVGTWHAVTPREINLDDLGFGGCGNYGVKSVQADALHPERFYALFFCQGLWRSDDYGQTWSLISTGARSDDIVGCAGGFSISPRNTQDPPVVHVACIRSATGVNGYFRSSNGGIDFERYDVGTTDPSDNDQYYRPAIDPYDPDHLLMTGHATSVFVESTDGGRTWRDVGLTDVMRDHGGQTAEVTFVDTGDPATTRDTWLWVQAPTTRVGTWRTETAGAVWEHVDDNEHALGAEQFYQPDASGVIYMAGVYSAHGWGVLRSEDYGRTWAHVGIETPQSIVFGTPSHVYAMNGAAVDPSETVDPNLEIGPQPGTGEWTRPGTPPEMRQGPASAAVSFDGEHHVIVVASYNAGLWRYIEP